MRRHRALGEAPCPPDVDHRDDGAVGVVLDGNGEGISTIAVDEMGEWDEPLVANPPVAVDGDDAREVALLNPELGRMRELGQQARYDLAVAEQSPFPDETEVLLSDVLRENVGVVAKAVDRP